MGSGVVNARGINGPIPACRIASIFTNTHVGRRPLNVSAAMEDAPRSEPTTETPGHGPPIIVSGHYSPPAGGEVAPATSEAKGGLLHRLAPTREVQPRLTPELPTKKRSPPVPLSSTGHTPSQLSLPEPERPESLSEQPCPSRARQTKLHDFAPKKRTPVVIPLARSDSHRPTMYPTANAHNMKAEEHIDPPPAAPLASQTSFSTMRSAAPLPHPTTDVALFPGIAPPPFRHP